MFQSADTTHKILKRNDVIARRAQGGEGRLRKFGIVMNETTVAGIRQILLVR